MHTRTARACTACVRTVSRTGQQQQTRISPHCHRLYSRQRQYHHLHSANRLSPRRVLDVDYTQTKKARGLGYVRCFATADAQQQQQTGPMQEYERRVKADLLRDDAHQRGISYAFFFSFFSVNTNDRDRYYREPADPPRRAQIIHASDSRAPIARLAQPRK